MISNETLLHKPLQIGLGWLDDSMTLQGMTEGAPYPTWVEDTGSSAQDMQDHVNAYHANIKALQEKIVPMGTLIVYALSSSLCLYYNVFIINAFIKNHRRLLLADGERAWSASAVR